MKIALICFDLNIKGGTQRQMLQLGMHLQKFGHEVNIYSVFLSLEDSYINLLSSFKVSYLYYKNREEMKEFLTNNSIAKIAKKAKLYPVYILLQKNRLAKKIVYLVDPDTDIINIHDFSEAVPVFKNYFLKEFKKEIPIVLTCNDVPSKIWAYERLEKKLSISKKIFYNYLDLHLRKHLKSADLILVLDKLNQEVLRKYFGLDSKIIRSGVEVKSFSFSKNKKLDRKIINVMTVNILAKHRRIEDLIFAMKILKEKEIKVRLSIVGKKEETEYFEYLNNLIQKQGLMEEVKFLDQISEEELIKEYHKNDIFVFPNHNQTWGLAVFEAMASGLPVIVSRTAGAAEVLTHKENAILVNPKSPKEIADAIFYLINDKDLFQNLRVSARNLVEREFNFTKYSREVESLFFELLQQK